MSAIEDLLPDDLFVVVYVWASWCQPCKMLSPVIDSIKEEYAGRLEVIKVDADSDLMSGFVPEVRSVPTVRVYKDKVLLKEFVGAKPKPFFDRELAELL